MHWVSGSNHSSGKSTPFALYSVPQNGPALCLTLSPPLPLFLCLSDNSSRLSNCVFEWSYTAGWNLQSDTKNMFPSLAVCLSIHTLLQQSGLSTPGPPSSPAVPAVAAPPSPLTAFFFLHTASSAQPARAGVNNSCAPCCNWCHHFNLSWLQLRAAYRVTRGGITHSRAQWAATHDQA